VQLRKRLKIKWKIALRQCVYHLLSGCKKENQLRVWPIRSGVVRQTLSRCANASTFCPSEGGLITFFHLREAAPASQPSSLHFNPAVLRTSKTHSQPERESFIYIHTLRSEREPYWFARSALSNGARQLVTLRHKIIGRGACQPTCLRPLAHPAHHLSGVNINAAHTLRKLFKLIFTYLRTV